MNYNNKKFRPVENSENGETTSETIFEYKQSGKSILEEIELKELKIEIGNEPLKIQVEKFNNLFEPKFCNFGSYQKITEAYQDGDKIYIYIYGGDAASSYFSKLVFDSTGYVTSIIANYGPLSEYGSFGEGFIGF